MLGWNIDLVSKWNLEPNNIQYKQRRVLSLQTYLEALENLFIAFSLCFSLLEYFVRVWMLEKTSVNLYFGVILWDYFLGVFKINNGFISYFVLDLWRTVVDIVILLHSACGHRSHWLNHIKFVPSLFSLITVIINLLSSLICYYHHNIIWLYSTIFEFSILANWYWNLI